MLCIYSVAALAVQTVPQQIHRASISARCQGTAHPCSQIQHRADRQSETETTKFNLVNFHTKNVQKKKRHVQPLLLILQLATLNFCQFVVVFIMHDSVIIMGNPWSHNSSCPAVLSRAALKMQPAEFDG